MSLTSGSDLFQRVHRDHDDKAREELVLRHLPLARKLAGRYARTQEPFDDLYQVACLGLVKAIDRFDAERGVTFASFAVPTILGELKRHFRDKGWSVHLPRGLQELVLKVQDADAKLNARLGRSPTVVEIAQFLEARTEDVVEALDALAAHRAASLDAPVETGIEDGSNTRHDLVGAEDERFALVELYASMKSAIAELAERDQDILALRFDEKLTQREIAGRIGVSQMQVSRMLRRITTELRTSMELPPAAADGGDRRQSQKRKAR
ncbi:MAG TPA: SigB/SigF/SigG family RNA polymerase sigma factor [Solirubrobacteraceae bacterium]|jgi:RNA polymerase sigma-B factor